jgi:RNA polymerase sigma-70 factor (ECF subfamily)
MRNVVKPADPFVQRLVAEHGEDLLRFLARRVRCAADARDLAQEAYVRLLRLERKDLIRDPQAYVYRVAANLLHEFELKRRADAAGMRQWTEEQAIDDTSPGADRAADAMLIGTKLREVLDELTPKCRAVLVLHRRDGMTYEEIGELLEISPSMVKKYLAIGLRHCCGRLRDLK